MHRSILFYGKIISELGIKKWPQKDNHRSKFNGEFNTTMVINSETVHQ